MENDNQIEELLLKQAKKLFKQNQILIEKIQTIVDSDVDIPNIGITFNNKLVEIFSIFSEKNISFYHSELRVLIDSILMKKIEEALNILKDYIYSIEKIMNLKKKYSNKSSLFQKFLHNDIYEEIDQLSIMASELLDLYRGKDDEIFNFDIGITIPNMIVVHPEMIKELLEQIDYSLSEEQVLHNCNIDLKKLGFSNPIETEKYKEDYSNSNKYINSINMNFIIYDLVMEKVEYYKKKYQDYPFIKYAIEETLLDYLEDGMKAFRESNWKSYQLIEKEINYFHVDESLLEIIGKRIGFIQYLDTMGYELDDYNYQQELKDLGFRNMIPIIEKEAKERKYYNYGKKQYEKTELSQKQRKH